jgi:HPt (histidine-containing phosphotransfer) domain-containing protein
VADDETLDLTRLVEAFDNDVASIAKLLTLARESEKRYIEALRAAIAHEDLVAVARAAHSIKGSASNIGASKVSGVAARIEDSARSSVWDGIDQGLSELDDLYAQLCERIAAYAAHMPR